MFRKGPGRTIYKTLNEMCIMSAAKNVLGNILVSGLHYITYIYVIKAQALKYRQIIRKSGKTKQKIKLLFLNLYHLHLSFDSLYKKTIIFEFYAKFHGMEEKKNLKFFIPAHLGSILIII
jgi:hypothetical protein